MNLKPENELKSFIGKRIRERREELKLSRQFVADYVNVALSTMQAWENEGREPNATNILKLAECLHASVQWLVTGETKETVLEQGTNEVLDTLGMSVDVDEFAFIPRYDVRAAAGHGAWNDEEEPRFSMAFRKYWIHNYLNASENDLSVITVSGNSMEGCLNDRDVILINHADTDPKEGVYVLRLDGHLVVKLVQRLPGNILSVTSTNTAYASFSVDLNSLPDDFAVIGRVAWFGRTI